ncbi:MAG: hypothetical protein VCF24_01080 [Candidatus Latescibacterota bacterium]
MDLFIANDKKPNFLFVNNDDGTFTEDAAVSPASPTTTRAWPSPPWVPTWATSTTTAVST